MVPIQLFGFGFHFRRVVDDARRPRDFASGVLVHPISKRRHPGVGGRRQIIRLLPRFVLKLHLDLNSVHG